MEFAPVGVLGGAFVAMSVPISDPSSVDRAVLNREMGCDVENNQKQIPLPHAGSG